MRTLSKKAKVAVASAAVVGLSGTGVAYAYWTTGGSGTGTASTRAGAAEKLSVSGDNANAMYPGDTARTVTATVTNNGSENYKVQTLKVWLEISDPQATNGCTSADYLVNGSPGAADAASASSITITPIDLAPAGTTTATFTMQFNNLATPQDFCKGAGITLHYIAT
jgi:hypothetical protein